MATERVTADFSIAAPFARVAAALVAHETLALWPCVHQVSHDHGRVRVSGELRVPGAPHAAPFRTDVITQSRRPDDQHVIIRHIVQSPRTELLWQIEPDGAAGAHCSLTVEYPFLGPSMLRALVVPSIERAIAENLRGFVARLRASLAQPDRAA